MLMIMSQNRTCIIPFKQGLYIESECIFSTTGDKKYIYRLVSAESHCNLGEFKSLDNAKESLKNAVHMFIHLDEIKDKKQKNIIYYVPKDQVTEDEI